MTVVITGYDVHSPLTSRVLTIYSLLFISIYISSTSEEVRSADSPCLATFSCKKIQEVAKGGDCLIPKQRKNTNAA